MRCARQLSEGADPNAEPPVLKRTHTLHASSCAKCEAATNTQVSFRCHFGAEMRVLNVGGRSTLASLQSQLSTLFGKQFAKIRWKDTDGDLINIVSDEDLQEACYLSEERNIVNLYLIAAP